MLLSPVSDTEIKGAQLLSGATMAGFLAARYFGKHANALRAAITVVYIAAIGAFFAYHLILG